MCHMYVWCLWRSEEDAKTGDLELWIGMRQLPCTCWEQNLGPLYKQQVPLTSEPLLQPLRLTFWDEPSHWTQSSQCRLYCLASMLLFGLPSASITDMHIACLTFYMDAEGLSSGSHVCRASSFLAESSSPPLLPPADLHVCFPDALFSLPPAVPALAPSPFNIIVMSFPWVKFHTFPK